MLKEQWKRIAGLHQQDTGDVSVVWLALDPDADTVHLYDSATFREDDTLPVIVAGGLNARGRYIPIAHNSKELSKVLLDRGCNMLSDECSRVQARTEVVSRDIAERMRTGRFKVDRRLADWLDEYRSFFRDDAKVPTGSHPLMAATRHAMFELEYAKAQSGAMTRKNLYAKVAMV